MCLSCVIFRPSSSESSSSPTPTPIPSALEVFADGTSVVGVVSSSTDSVGLLVVGVWDEGKVEGADGDIVATSGDPVGDAVVGVCVTGDAVVGAAELKLCCEGAAVGVDSEGREVSSNDGEVEGTVEGNTVAVADGKEVGPEVATRLGAALGTTEGAELGRADGVCWVIQIEAALIVPTYWHTSGSMISSSTAGSASTSQTTETVNVRLYHDDPSQHASPSLKVMFTAPSDAEHSLYFPRLMPVPWAPILI